MSKIYTFFNIKIKPYLFIYIKYARHFCHNFKLGVEIQHSEKLNALFKVTLYLSVIDWLSFLIKNAYTHPLAI